MRLFAIFLCLLGSLFADPLHLSLPNIWDPDCMGCIPRAMCPKELSKDLIYVDLANPIYSDGALQTIEGGVIHAKDLRIQARKIHYLKNDMQCTVYCEGNLLIDYKEWTLTGESFFYDFSSKTGYLIKGHTAAPPWYIGSKRMEIRETGDIFVINGYITTSEGPSRDVALLSPRIRLSKNRILSAKDVTLLVKKFPIAWFPGVKVDLKSLESSPFSVQFGWGGFMASYLSVLYHFLDWDDLQGYARVDGFFKYGVGLGIDTRYNPKNRPLEFYTRNYWAHDLPLFTPTQANRWRYQGVYSDKLYDQKLTVKATYDVVSDAQMATQYDIKDFELKTAGRTQLDIRRQEPWWIANLFTQVRVNNFQSINQELPSFKFNLHSVEIPRTGIIASGNLEAGYLHYMFSKYISPASGFDSVRISACPSFYRPFHFKWCTVTPKIGGIGIYYSDNDANKQVGQAELVTGVRWESSAYRRTETLTHALVPYIDYQFLAAPRVPNDRHYIFTINDGLGRVNRFRFGLQNSLFFRQTKLMKRPLSWDVWGNLFIKDNVAFPDQKGYLLAEYYPFQNIAFHFFGGWDFTQRVLDRANPRVDVTLNENLAFAAEYRYRCRFAWRKADFYNFVLENTRSLQELLDSPLSDRRETFLLRAFLRFNPDIGASFDLRRGWDRVTQPSYTEYSATLESVVFEHWRFNFVFEKRESDVRYTMSLRLDPGPPKLGKTCPKF